MVDNRSSVTIASRSVDMLTFSHQLTVGVRDTEVWIQGWHGERLR